MSKIAAIGAGDIHRLTSGQVIIDLVTAVKELVDNSIDANAHHIELIFKNYGIESVDCSDDGDGIQSENYDSLALKHYTSKISSFEDVSSVATLGFRGEALASLCAIANLSVVTTTNPPRADRLEYGCNGNLTSKSTTTRNKGTNIQVSQLFKNLPVRRKEFAKQCKRQFTKCVALIQNYALIQEGITFTVWHITPNGKKTRILSTGNEQGMPKKILNIYGASSMRGMASLDFVLDLNPYKKQMRTRFVEIPAFEDIDYKIKVHGYISKCSFGCGRTSKDRQSIYINKRPVEYPILLQGCNEIYRSFNNVQYPTVFLNFEISPKLVDVNVTPDKRTVMLHNERCVVDVFKESLQQYYDIQELELPVSSVSSSQANSSKKRRIDPGTADSYNAMNGLCKGNEEPSLREGKIVTTDKADKTAQELPKKTYVDLLNDNIGLQEENKNDESQAVADHQSQNYGEGPRTSPLVETLDLPEKIEKLDTSHNTSRRLQKIKTANNNDENASPQNLDSYMHLPNLGTPQLNSSAAEKKESVEVEIEGERENFEVTLSQNEQLVFVSNEASCDSCCSDHHSHSPFPDQQTPVVGNEDGVEDDEDGYVSYAQLEPTEVNVRSQVPIYANEEFSVKEDRFLSDIEAKGNGSYDHLSFTLVIDDSFESSSKVIDVITERKAAKHANTITKNRNLENFEESEKFLTLTVKKGDFKKMNIVGQFNLGFIIVTRKIGDKYDMFIVDQHASDEKYNFEVLQKITVFKSQRLIKPLPVELNVIDEMLVIENAALFEKNGFKLSIDENEAHGSRVQLYSLPVSKRTLFDVNDFHELLCLIKENGGMNLESLRPSKIRSMFAMRACRSSIMIGKPLAKKTMQKVVRNLSELEKPWNCPHGRPTMRHLMELKDWDSFAEDYHL